MVEIKKELLAPCGLYCGVCAVYIAHRDNNLKFKKRIVDVYPFTTKVEQIKCTGCLSEEEVFEVCQHCPIKSCTQKKEIEGCHQCNDFPCKYIENFIMPVGKKVILRAIPQWREWGTEKWVEEEIKRYHCPECGNPLFRGAKQCNKCKAPVDVD
ncbi:MAG: DUF3795 domain-containing protein [Candidatus Lokiarchaeota archaeon]|nr:DUF3795 domain-containing protein [Candidatus Lokiarchaeota archaeon]